jgi:hypothetical protein
MKYRPLQEHLQALPASKDSVTLSFAEIERILGTKLPKSAYEFAPWWANQSYGSQAPAWLGAGFMAKGVSLGSKSVTFRRESAARTKTNRKPATKKVARMNSKPIPARALLDAGFSKSGTWTRKGEKIELQGDIPSESGVYAHVVNDEVVYIGSATIGLRKRLYFYAKPGPRQITNLRLNELIGKELSAGKRVEVLTACPEPTEWNGLPVDQVTGLESGLVKKLSPPWNKRGVAG